MKTLILCATIILAAVVCAQNQPTRPPPAKLYEVRCPYCLDIQTLWATQVGSNGGYSTNIAGVDGAMQTMFANFHCSECHREFTGWLPDKFVPKTIARPVNPGRPLSSSVSIQSLILKDGSSVMVSLEPVPGSVPTHQIEINSGESIYIYVVKKQQ